MTVSITIKPELEAQLANRARCTGQSLEELIQALLIREVETPVSNPAGQLNGSQKAEALRAWAESFPASLPVLTLQQISRDEIYRPD